MWKADLYRWSKKFGHDEFCHSIEQESRALLIGRLLKLIDLESRIDLPTFNWAGFDEIYDDFAYSEGFLRAVIQNNDEFENETQTRDDLKKMMSFL